MLWDSKGSNPTINRNLILNIFRPIYPEMAAALHTETWECLQCNMRRACTATVGHWSQKPKVKFETNFCSNQEPGWCNWYTDWAEGSTTQESWFDSVEELGIFHLLSQRLDSVWTPAAVLLIA